MLALHPRRPALRSRLQAITLDPSGIVAAVATATLLITAIIPYPSDVERYWHAWLGEKILTTHAVPHALGRESPLNQGSPWVVQQWLYAVIVAIMRDLHVFWIMAFADALGAASLIWFARYECRRTKVEPGLSFLITLMIGITVYWRFQIRAETLTFPLLIATYIIARSQSARRCWLTLPFIFLLWANIHASFPLGIGLCAYGAITNRRLQNLWPIAAAALITLINPNGIGLWGYILWVPHSWIKNTLEWQPTYNYDPILIAPLLLPLLLLTKPLSLRPEARYGLGLWATLTIAAIESVRFIPLAIAFGIPAACGAIESRFTLPLRVNTWILVTGVVLFFAEPFALFHIPLFVSRPVLDPAFGLVVPQNSAQIAIPKIPPEPWNVTLCTSEFDCTVLLYYGGATVYDQRMDPFPQSTVEPYERFYTGPDDTIPTSVVRIIANVTIPKLQPPSNFRRVDQKGDLIVYERDFQLRPFEGPNK
jgi:hypothetical protein